MCIGSKVPVLLGLLILELLDNCTDLLHAVLDLRHQILLSIERCLLVASLTLAYDVEFLLEPVLRGVIILHSECDLIFNLAVKCLNHRLHQAQI